MSNTQEFKLTPTVTQGAASHLVDQCFGASKSSGWWTDMATGQDLSKPQEDGKPRFNVPEKLCLIHSEVSEAMEGYRKDLNDDHLPHRKMIEVELADAAIRIFDLAGGLGLDIAGAIAEKLHFNSKRADHKITSRMADGGKKF